MKGINKSDIVKLKIMRLLEQESKLSPSMLAKKINCKYETVLKSLNFLEILHIVSRENERKGDKIYAYYGITDLGRRVLKDAEIN